METYGVVYKLTNTENGHFYIGQTKTALASRWSKHCSDAARGAGWVLAAAIRKYGREKFTKEVLFACFSKEELNAKEIEIIAQLKPPYNACAGGAGVGSPTKEVRLKISAANKGRVFSEEHRKKISEGLKGRPYSEETKEKIRSSIAGRSLRKSPIRQEEKDRIIAQNIAARKHPVNTELLEHYKAVGAKTKQEKMSAATKLHHSKNPDALRGVNNPMFGKGVSEDIKQKLSEKMQGESNPFFGKQHSEQTRDKMRAAHASRPVVACPHCQMQGQTAFKRWHFDNCRSKA